MKLIAIFFIFFCLTATAQDYIKFKNGDEINCKIKNITTEDIFFIVPADSLKVKKAPLFFIDRYAYNTSVKVRIMDTLQVNKMSTINREDNKSSLNHSEYLNRAGSQIKTGAILMLAGSTGGIIGTLITNDIDSRIGIGVAALILNVVGIGYIISGGAELQKAAEAFPTNRK